MLHIFIEEEICVQAKQTKTYKTSTSTKKREELKQNPALHNLISQYKSETLPHSRQQTYQTTHLFLYEPRYTH